ncbi:MAG: nucleotidyltransferase family protein [Rhodospirillaceae bacterium]|nr:nucleotidyltransferase family protein [Rhodospirillaceae bacterium]
MTEDDLEGRFLELAFANKNNRAILERLLDLGAPDAWLVAGCLYQSVWNAHDGRPPEVDIKDYDIFYYDASDLSYEAEDEVIKRGDALFADLGVEVEVRNQARVPLWFEQHFGAPYPPISGSAEGIERFVVECTCLGIRPDGKGGHAVEAPYGFQDMFDGILRYNAKSPTPHHFESKAGSYKARWPWLTIVPMAG